MLQVKYFFLDYSFDSLSTPWEIEKKHLFLGSCFANDIGLLLCDNGINGEVNPLGTIFNPMTLLQHLKCATGATQIEKKHIAEKEGVVFSLDWHTDFYSNSKESFIANAETQYDSLVKSIEDAAYITITLGTAIYYEFKETGQFVANCHQLPAKLFDRKIASVDQIKIALIEIEAIIHQLNPAIQIVYTVSPVRHKKEGLHNNNLSKSTLLLAISECQQHTDSAYFPSYELAIDVLRDYRFYKADHVHLNQEGIQIIYNYFLKYAYAESELKKIAEVEKFRRDQQHRIQFPNSKSGIAFQEKLVQQKEALTQKYPYLF